MNFKKILVLAIFTIAIVGIIAPLNATSIDNNVKIESKSKTASYKIALDGNGGKIGTKKTVY